MLHVAIATVRNYFSPTQEMTSDDLVSLISYQDAARTCMRRITDAETGLKKLDTLQLTAEQRAAELEYYHEEIQRESEQLELLNTWMNELTDGR